MRFFFGLAARISPFGHGLYRSDLLPTIYCVSNLTQTFQHYRSSAKLNTALPLPYVLHDESGVCSSMVSTLEYRVLYAAVGSAANTQVIQPALLEGGIWVGGAMLKVPLFSIYASNVVHQLSSRRLPLPTPPSPPATPQVFLSLVRVSRAGLNPALTRTRVDLPSIRSHDVKAGPSARSRTFGTHLKHRAK